MFDSDFRRHVPPHLRAAMDRLRDPQAVWDIFRNPQIIGEMERLTIVKRPAVGAASAQLVALGDWVREDDARRTFGKIARFIMEANGYIVADKGVETPGDPLFRKGARYRLRRSSEHDQEGTTLVLRIRDADLFARLQDRAKRSGHSLEAEALRLLTDATSRDGGEEPNLAEAIHRRFAAFGGVDDLVPHPPVPTDSAPTIEP